MFLFATAIISFNDSATVKAHVVGSSGASVTVIEGSSQYAVIVSHADRWFNPSRISRAINDCKNKTGYVFVISGVDVNSFMTKFNALSMADVVYYFDQIAENDSAIYENSFKGVSFNRNQVGERIDFKDFSVEFNEGGKAAKVVSGGQSICVFGEFNDNADFNLGYYDLVIAYDYVERISALYQYKTFLSYRRYGNVLNAENQGNYVFKFI